jgi:DUF1009 family protein
MVLPTASTAPRIAVIAGAGQFPLLVAQEAKRQGHAVIAFGVQGWADPSLAQAVEAYESVEVGSIGVLIARLKAHAVRQAIMAGKVTKDVLFRPATAFDTETLNLLRAVKGASVNALLGAIAKRLAREGITLMDSSTFLKSSLCPAGVLTTAQPSAAQQGDIRVGVQAARRLASLDVGQTVVIKRGVIVAVEALEGTDAAIRRAHALAGGELVVVKAASPKQDLRFDLPVLGCETVDVLRESGVSCLAVQARKTLLLEKDRLIASANAAGLCLVGIRG